MANWLGFTSAVAPFLDAPIGQTHEQTAQHIAQQYEIATRPTIITMIGAPLIKTPFYGPMKQAIMDSFDMVKDSGGMPKPIHFQPWANEIVNYWLGSVWSPLPPPIGYISPTVGNIVLTGGTPTPLNVQICDAFILPRASTPMGNLICTKLVLAFTNHLMTVKGIYNGLIPAAPSPVPGPPFPWIGVT